MSSPILKNVFDFDQSIPLDRRLALSLERHPELELAWQRDKQSNKQPITEEDLWATLQVIERGDRFWKKKSTYKRRGKQKNRWRELRVGLSITRLSKTLRCHRAKATRLLAILRDLPMIEKTANYSSGRRGNCYRVLDEGQLPSPPPRPLPRPVPQPELPPRPGDMDDPF